MKQFFVYQTEVQQEENSIIPIDSCLVNCNQTVINAIFFKVSSVGMQGSGNQSVFIT